MVYLGKAWDTQTLGMPPGPPGGRIVRGGGGGTRRPSLAPAGELEEEDRGCRDLTLGDLLPCWAGCVLGPGPGRTGGGGGRPAGVPGWGAPGELEEAAVDCACACAVTLSCGECTHGCM